MMFIDLVWGCHLIFSLMMVGIIWFVQWVHYPLFHHVPSDEFPSYEAQHVKRTGQLIAPLMILELGTGGLLVMLPSDFILPLWAWINLGGILLLWLSTFIIQVPLHQSLGEAGRTMIIRKLVASNWLRTVIWSLRAILLICCVVKPEFFT
ncbi:MAG: hypothetical protein AAFR59_02545 [Bacteroidota bacterium]